MPIQNISKLFIKRVVKPRPQRSGGRGYKTPRPKGLRDP